jgi:phenylacetate-coenzyme A ligase PaaK-like adenylate-forming protein
MLAETFVRWRTAREHKRSAKLTRAELEAEKLEKFRRLVRYAEQRSPHYRRIVAERGVDIEGCTPGDFPVLTKSLLRKCCLDSLSPPPFSGKWASVHSGTTMISR